MQVGTGGVTSAAADTQHLALLYILTRADRAAAHMSIQGSIAAAVADHYIVAVRTAVLGYDDCSRLGCQDLRRIAHAADIHAFVIGGADAAW